MIDRNRTRSKWRIETESRLRAPTRTWLPPFAIQRLWALAKARGEHPQETASHLLLERLYPDPRVRKRLLRRWRREIWSRGRGVRREMAA